MNPLPDKTRVIVIGAGFAGVAIAWALGQTNSGPGIIVEREPTPGAHASGRNAGLMRVVETDPVMRRLALRSVALIRQLAAGHGDLIRSTGSLTLASGASRRTTTCRFRRNKTFLLRHRNGLRGARDTAVPVLGRRGSGICFRDFVD